jgi:hypothetical protein
MLKRQWSQPAVVERKRGRIELRFPYQALAAQTLQRLQEIFGDGTFAVLEEAGFANAAWS